MSLIPLIQLYRMEVATGPPAVTQFE